jgi:secreted trypsin-like serine protease
LQAYDLAAAKFRGQDAVTNFHPDLYASEMEENDSFTREQVVECLRNQSKAMNKIDNSTSVAQLEQWEVALATAIHPNKLHIGVYRSEVEAARAYDRGLIRALGLQAAMLLNFPLVDYLDMLSKS